MISHDETTNTWTITHGRDTLRGFPTREQACEALYDLERGGQPATREADGDGETLAGCLPPGTPVLADTISGHCFWLDGTGDFAIWVKGESPATIFKRPEVVALYRFLHQEDVEDLMCGIMRDHMLATGSPPLRELVYWIDAHLAQPAPPALPESRSA